MPNVNRVILVGHLTRDIETRTAGSSTVANVGLAVSHKFKTAAGEQREETCFLDCEAWGKQAEILTQYVGKGDPIYLEGRLKLDQWEDKDGSKRSKVKVVIENFQFLGGKKDGGTAPAPAPARTTNNRTPARGFAGHQPMDEDSIPFSVARRT